jgi:hypothetical protein
VIPRSRRVACASAPQPLPEQKQTNRQLGTTSSTTFDKGTKIGMLNAQTCVLLSSLHILTKKSDTRYQPTVAMPEMQVQFKKKEDSEISEGILSTATYA